METGTGLTRSHNHKIILMKSSLREIPESVKTRLMPAAATP